MSTSAPIGLARDGVRQPQIRDRIYESMPSAVPHRADVDGHQCYHAAHDLNRCKVFVEEENSPYSGQNRLKQERQPTAGSSWVGQAYLGLDIRFITPQVGVTYK